MVVCRICVRLGCMKKVYEGIRSNERRFRPENIWRNSLSIEPLLNEESSLNERFANVPALSIFCVVAMTLAYSFILFREIRSLAIRVRPRSQMSSNESGFLQSPRTNKKTHAGLNFSCKSQIL
jgi:hypothetical protein